MTSDTSFQDTDIVEEHHFPCDQCGADMRFAPHQGKLICDHCGNEAEVEIGEGTAGPWGGNAIRELDFDDAIRNRLPKEEIEETRVTQCPNCGAQVEFSADTHADECPFCATPVVTDTGTHRHIKPKGLLPFSIGEEAARDAMTQWLGRLWFAPNGLQDYARKGRKMEGIYVPYWTFDADTRSAYRGQRGTIYYVTVSAGKGRTRQQQRIRWHRTSGRVARFFDDVLVLASKSLPKRFTDALAPWDLSALQPYSPQYLAGFRAEGYTVELEEGMVEARQIMDAHIARDIRRDIGGDRQRIDHVTTDVSDVTFKHILLPVWLAAYKYRGKSFRFVVNAQTGKVEGERPYSAIKIAFAILGALIVISIGAYLYALYGEGGGAATGFAPSTGGLPINK